MRCPDCGGRRLRRYNPDPQRASAGRWPIYDWLYHTTRVKNLKKIATTRKLVPGKSGPFVSFSETPLSGPYIEGPELSPDHYIVTDDEGGFFGQITLVFRKTSLLNRLREVSYTKEWMRKYPNQAYYVSGLLWDEEKEYIGALEGIEEQEEEMGRPWTRIEKDEYIKSYVEEALSDIEQEFLRYEGEGEWLTKIPGRSFTFYKGELVAILVNNTVLTQSGVRKGDIDIDEIREIFAKLLLPRYIVDVEAGLTRIDKKWFSWKRRGILGEQEY